MSSKSEDSFAKEFKEAFQAVEEINEVVRRVRETKGEDVKKETKQLSDREMLMFAYGALRANETRYGMNKGRDPVVEIVEEHLWPPRTIIRLKKKGDQNGV